jgi:hypothetical protein
MRYLPLFAISLLLTFVGCDRSPVFPIEPQIEFVDIQPRVVQHLRDSIVVKFRFQDGDGDLGSINPDEKNLTLIDSRFEDGTLTQAQAYNLFTVMNLTPDARKPSIQGEISVTIPFTSNLPGQLEEEIRYQIVLKDRADHLAKGIDGSEKVYTDFIKIVR